MRKIILLPLIVFSFMFIIAGCKEEENPVIPPSEHFEPEGWVLTGETQNLLLVVWQGEIRNNWNSAEINDTLFTAINTLTENISVSFLDSDMNPLQAPGDADYTFNWVITDTSYFDVAQGSDKWKFQLRGQVPGLTTLELQVLHQGHADVRTPKIPVKVN